MVHATYKSERSRSSEVGCPCQGLRPGSAQQRADLQTTSTTAPLARPASCRLERDIRDSKECA
jgi:hypothetical protein